MTEITKIDLGCGSHPKEGFTGVDQYAMEGVDIVCDLKGAWPFEDNSIEEAYSSHFIEHLTGQERVHFWNELYRVLKPDAKATIITPHWASNRAYGDPTHQWPPVSEMAMYYLSKEWRDANAPHTDIEWNKDGFNCSYVAVWGYGMHPALIPRHEEYKNYAMANYKEAVLDMHATVTAKKPSE